jgi:MATE family multidrug resistance protein
MFAAGISSGSSICVAKSYGNKNAENIKAYGKNAHILGVSIMFFFSIVLIVFSTPLAHLFSNEKEVYELGARLLILAGVFQLGDGIQAISLGLLRGIEDTAIPSVIIFIAYWFISMPLAYYLCFKSPFQMEFLSGVEGLWVGLTTGLILTAIFLSTRFYVLIRNNKP